MAALRPLAILVAVACCSLANAADLPPAPKLPPLMPESEDFSGWYLRGDLGIGVNAAPPRLEIAPDPLLSGIASGLLSTSASQTFNNATLSPLGMIDVGGGYQFNDWLRMDATFEYRGGADLKSRHVLTDPMSPLFGGQAQISDAYRANLSSFVGLINGYANLGTWFGFSPFLGAGVGVADNRLSGVSDQGYTVAGSAVFGPAGGGFSGGSRTAFAWALMAGVDFDLAANLKLEFGYRYLSYGSITTGASNCLVAGGGTSLAASCAGGVANTISSRNRLASNDFRIGLIYMLGEAPALPVVASY